MIHQNSIQWQDSKDVRPVVALEQKQNGTISYLVAASAYKAKRLKSVAENLQYH